MTQLKNNVKVTIGGRSVTVERLDESQQKQLSELLQLTAVPYSWDSWLVTGPTIGARLTALWRRIGAWAMPLLLIVALSAPAFAQQALQPVRVSVSAQRHELDATVVDAVRDELRRRRDAAIVSRGAAFDIQLTASRVSDNCRGYAVAVLVVRRSDNLHDLSIYVGSDVQELAKYITETINKEHFTRWREDAFLKNRK